jgi:N-acetylglucosaminyldiphosphoundecaprenol N-acetyl-beta-D-mannosaminyltransferase
MTPEVQALPAPRVDLMGVTVDRVSEAEAIDRAVAGLRDGRGGWICPANLDVLRQAVQAPEVHSLVEQADLVVADGMPLLWASRLQGVPLPERVAGSSLVSTLPRAVAKEGAGVFLLGGDPGVAELAGARLADENPGLRVCGTHCPPHGFERSPEQLAAIERALDEARPDVVFVGLGFPKQERLIVRLRRRLPRTWFVSVGIGLGFLSGHTRRAPRWLQRAGLEWLHRLVHEPRRLARRYLVDGVPFLARVLAHSARRRVVATR